MDTVPGERHVSGVYTKVLLDFVAESTSDDRIRLLLHRAGERRSLDQLRDVSSWSSYGQFRRLLEARTTIDPTPLHEQTALLSAWLSRWEMTEAAHGHESPSTLLAGGSDGNPLVPIRSYEKSEEGPTEWTIRERFVDGYAPYPEFCDFAALQYSLIPLLFDFPPGEVTEEECQCRGDQACLFRFRWEPTEGSASGGDFFRVRSELLEAELEQLRDMITDLASNESYEDVLQGFVTSSLRGAVGAGGAVLALEARPGLGREVYAEGYTPSEAATLAGDLLAGTVGSTSVEAVEVASARRRYGVLALGEGGGVFSAHSRSTLETNARLAAAALDTADALDEARHQANTARALLELSTSLVEVESSREMAAKVARAVPDIIDCDRAAVFLDEAGPETRDAGSFRLAGSSGYSEAAVALLAARSFPKTAVPSPVADRSVHHALATFGNAATVTAPIVVTGETIGFIAVSVSHHSERLSPTPRLTERLTGLAAQASIAIANARLVDQIRFQAVHDALTGLPNRALIIDRAEQMLTSATRRSGAVAALFLDLDGFKEVNDTLGHGAGDQVLREVGRRLSTSMRESDTVGRLGGDEFVVLVDGTAADAEPELVAGRLLEVLSTPFELDEAPGRPVTLSASIGIAIGVRLSAADLLADADRALYRAKAAGKNCFAIFEGEADPSSLGL